MGIKSNNKAESYFNFFGASGTDAMDPAPVPVYTEATGGVISDYTDPGPVYKNVLKTESTEKTADGAIASVPDAPKKLKYDSALLLDLIPILNPQIMD